MPYECLITAALAGIIGSLLVGISDVLGAGQVRPMPFYWRQPWMYFAGLPRWRMRACLAGSLALPLASAGYVVVFAMLAPAGILAASAAVLPMAYFMLLGTSIHTQISLLGELADCVNQRTWPLPTSELVDDYRTRSLQHLRLITSPALVAYAIGSTCFSMTVWFSVTRYPAWMGLFNPFLLTLGLRRLFVYLPPNPFGWIRPAVVHLVHTPLLMLSTYFLWKSM